MPLADTLDVQKVLGAACERLGLRRPEDPRVIV